MARQDVLPRALGKVLATRRTPWAGIAFSTILALGLILYVTSDPGSNIVANLSGTTAFLLLCVFTVVNVACLVLRRKRDPNRKVFFTSPGLLPLLAAVLCAFLAGPWVGRNVIQYQIAGGLMAIGVVLWLITWLINERTNIPAGEPVGMRNVGKDEGLPPMGR
jgi:amino acid transporter